MRRAGTFIAEGSLNNRKNSLSCNILMTPLNNRFYFSTTFLEVRPQRIMALVAMLTCCLIIKKILKTFTATTIITFFIYSEQVSSKSHTSSCLNHAAEAPTLKMGRFPNYLQAHRCLGKQHLTAKSAVFRTFQPCRLNTNYVLLYTKF